MLEVQQSQSGDFLINNDGVLHLGNRLCMLDVDNLRKEITEEVYFFCIQYPSRFYQNIPWFQKYLLVKWDEKRHCRVCIQVPYMLAGKTWASKTIQFTLIAPYFWMEIGYDYNGFYF